MKNQIYLSMCCLLLFCMPGCSDDDVKETTVEFTTFSLPANCEWNKLTDKTLYRIDSSSELQTVILPNESSTFPVINFEKYTLLLTQTTLPNSGYKVIVGLKKIGDNYKYEILYKDNNTTQPAVPSVVTNAILIEKVGKAVPIELKIEER